MVTRDFGPIRRGSFWLTISQSDGRPWPTPVSQRQSDQHPFVLASLISTINVKLDWGAMIGTLAPNGRLHVAGAVLEPIPAHLTAA
jgi:hypothetical protein